MNAPGKVYLIPTVLQDDALQTLPAYLLDAIKNCSVFFVENEKTTRRFFKKLWKEMVIDDYQWFVIHKAEAAVKQQFVEVLEKGYTVGILSEAGCPGIADPGQLLVEAAQVKGFKVMPLVGPNSILLALMASGMNGQCFQFNGYLPIDSMERRKKIKALEANSASNDCTQIFIETPYRNNQLLGDILQSCNPDTFVCIGKDITGPNETIVTKKAAEWRKQLPELHKIPVIFLLKASI
ncbi:MAG: SAM-dependent methyltransferase [Sphingobacteriia bacterium]|nr:MAG: SAM-dependent methyltransferase [Sphingobacteriia bacterium]TAG30888.1 MAG: SAM-dependent methyltransferase [Sphingobacteriia bacterium]